MLCLQLHPSPPEGRMGQPSRTKEQTGRTDKPDFHYKIIKYSPDLKAWNKLHGATRFRSCKIRDHGPCMGLSYDISPALMAYPYFLVQLLAKNNNNQPSFLKRILEEAKKRLMLRSPGPDQPLIWLPKFSKLCSSLWKAAVVAAAQSWNGQSTLVQAEWGPHWGKHYMAGCRASTHFCVALSSWWHSSLLTDRTSETWLGLPASKSSVHLHCATCV